MSAPSPMKRRVPFDDFAGKPIFEGDSIRHPDGKTATVSYDVRREFGEWRAVYADGVSLWLGNQVDDRGMAVVVPTPEPAKQGAYRPLCSTCGDQGHVHRADGEYLGTCDNCTVYELSCVKHELAQAKQVIADHVEQVSTNTQERRERWLLNIADAIKFGLPNYLRERLQNTEKQIRASMRYGGTKRLRDEVARLTAELERVKDLNHIQFGDAVRRNAEVEILKPDAERYQWIKKGSSIPDRDHCYFLPVVDSWDYKPGPQLNEQFESLDAAIDDAMRKELAP